MIETVNEKISVLTFYNKQKGLVYPIKIRYCGQNISILKVAYHHKCFIGKKLVHYFAVSSRDTDFKLRLDTDTLHWFLEEVCDGT